MAPRAQDAVADGRTDGPADRRTRHSEAFLVLTDKRESFPVVFEPVQEPAAALDPTGPFPPRTRSWKQGVFSVNGTPLSMVRNWGAGREALGHLRGEPFGAPAGRVWLQLRLRREVYTF